MSLNVFCFTCIACTLYHSSLPKLQSGTSAELFVNVSGGVFDASSRQRWSYPTVLGIGFCLLSSLFQGKIIIKGVGQQEKQRLGNSRCGPGRAQIHPAWMGAWDSGSPQQLGSWIRGWISNFRCILNACHLKKSREGNLIGFLVLLLQIYFLLFSH